MSKWAGFKGAMMEMNKEVNVVFGPRHRSSGWSLASEPGSSHVGFVVDKVALG
jgi:hypothetical protein